MSLGSAKMSSLSDKVDALEEARLTEKKAEAKKAEKNKKKRDD